MKTQYYALVGTTQKVVMLDNNVVAFDVSIRVPAGVTVEQAVENPVDVASGPPTVPAGTAMVWLACPAAVNGIINLLSPVGAIRFTPTAGGNVTIAQQGIR